MCDVHCVSMNTRQYVYTDLYTYHGNDPVYEQSCAFGECTPTAKRLQCTHMPIARKSNIYALLSRPLTARAPLVRTSFAQWDIVGCDRRWMGLYRPSMRNREHHSTSHTHSSYVTCWSYRCLLYPPKSTGSVRDRRMTYLSHSIDRVARC